MKTRFKTGGFTLIELMITIVVFAILLAIAIPAFSNLFQKYRLKSAAERLAAEVRYAQSLAAARSGDASITVTGGDSSAWWIGVDMEGAPAGDDKVGCELPPSKPAYACKVDNVARTVAGANFQGVSLPAGTTTIEFGGVRGLPASTTSFPITFALDHDNGEKVEVRISALGSVFVCSPSGASHVSGYDECPDPDGT